MKKVVVILFRNQTARVYQSESGRIAPRASLQESLGVDAAGKDLGARSSSEQVEGRGGADGDFRVCEDAKGMARGGGIGAARPRGVGTPEVGVTVSDTQRYRRLSGDA